MMTETAVEKSACESCGADVRDESVFCYNCGNAVKAEPPIVEKVDQKSEAPAPRPPLRSAASLRKHRRASNRQPVEITWERPEGSPTVFIITTVVLALAAAVLILLAFYLR